MAQSPALPLPGDSLPPCVGWSAVADSPTIFAGDPVTPDAGKQSGSTWFRRRQPRHLRRHHPRQREPPHRSHRPAPAPGGGGDLALISFDLDPEAGELILSWLGDAEKSYRVSASEDWIDWSNVLRVGIVGHDGPMNAAGPFSGGRQLFFRVEEK